METTILLIIIIILCISCLILIILLIFKKTYPAPVICMEDLHTDMRLYVIQKDYSVKAVYFTGFDIRNDEFWVLLDYQQVSYWEFMPVIRHMSGIEHIRRDDIRQYFVRIEHNYYTEQVSITTELANKLVYTTKEDALSAVNEHLRDKAHNIINRIK